MIKNKRLMLIPFIVVFLLFGNSGGKSFAQPAETHSAGLRVISSTDQETILEFQLPAVAINRRPFAGGYCQELLADGLSLAGAPGAPALPSGAALLAVPPGAAIQLEMIEPVTETIVVADPVCPVRQAAPDPGGIPGVLPSPEIDSMDAHAYRQDNFSPENPAVILQQGYLRSQSIAQIGIFPVQYNPSTGEVNLYHSFQLRLTFSGQVRTVESVSAVNAEGPFESLLRPNLLNYQQGRHWRTPFTRPDQILQTSAPEQPGYKLIIETEGIYEVTYADLKTAGVPVDTIDPRNFHLSQEGVELSIVVEGEQDGRFDPGDLISFYGWPAKTRFTHKNTFLLGWDQTPGLRAAPQNVQRSDASTSPAYFYAETLHDSNLVYLGNYPNGPEKERWYENYIFAPNPTFSKASYSIGVNSLPDLSSDPSAQAVIHGLFRGISAAPQHHIQLTLNAEVISDQFYAAQGDILVTAAFHPNLLTPGANSLTVESVIDSGITSSVFYVNWFKLYYPALFHARSDRFSFTSQPGDWRYRIAGFTSDQIEAFDISDPHNPQALSGLEIVAEDGAYTLLLDSAGSEVRRYLIQTQANRLSLTADSAKALILPVVAEGLKSTANGADYLVITSASLRAEAEDLAAYRRAQGLRARVVDLQAIYDTFNFGLPDPAAVQEFIRYAYENWELPAPLYVVLFGDGHYDFLNYLQRNEEQFVPPYLNDYDPWIIETSSDNAFVCVSGNDNLPDLLVGRLPVRSPQEARAAVSKIIAYESAPYEEWVKQAVLISDNPDSGGDFYASSDTLASLLPADYTAHKVYLGVAPFTTGALAKAGIKTNLNEGRGLSIYSGHGSRLFWANEQIFANQDVASLSTTTRFPLSLSLDCMDGYFVIPGTSSADYSSLSEVLIRPPDRGAVAVFAPAGWGVIHDHDLLARGLMEALFTYGLNTAGAATTYAKTYLAAHAGGDNALIDTYILFGDPALQLKLGPATAAQPGDLGVDLHTDLVGEVKTGDSVAFVLRYENLGFSPLQQVVLRADLPAGLTNLTVLAVPDISAHGVLPHTWLVSGLTPGASGQISFSGQVAEGFNGELRVLVSGTTTSPDADAFNNSDALAWQVNAPARYRYYFPTLSIVAP